MAEKFADSEKPKNPKRLSRRQFLTFAAVESVAGLVVLPLAVARLQREIIKIFARGFSFPEATDTAVAAALKICEKNGGKENPRYRPMAEIIREATSRYKASTGKAPLYQRSKSYRDKGYYANTLDTIGRGIILPQSPENLIEKLQADLPPEARSAYEDGNSRFAQFSDIYGLESGFRQRFKERHPAILSPKDTVKDPLSSRYFELADREAKAEIEKVKLFVEKASNEHQGPISASWIVGYFLQENSGRLAESIHDSAIFLKFMARCNTRTGEASSTQTNIDWFQRYILDEYQGPSYAESLDTETQLNLIGKPYHCWNLVALLQFFPVEFVHLGGIYRQMKTMKDQGIAKTWADLQTLKDLRGTEATLLGYK